MEERRDSVSVTSVLGHISEACPGVSACHLTTKNTQSQNQYPERVHQQGSRTTWRYDWQAEWIHLALAARGFQLPPQPREETEETLVTCQEILAKTSWKWRVSEKGQEIWLVKSVGLSLTAACRKVKRFVTEKNWDGGQIIYLALPDSPTYFMHGWSVRWGGGVMWMGHGRFDTTLPLWRSYPF